MHRPYFSVVVPTYNRLGRLRHVIAALEQQAYPSDAYEVIVISDGSTDGTDAYLETLRSTMRLRWLTQANQGPAAARNAGIQKAVGEFIVFIDDDVVPEPQLLEEHARSHHEAGRDVVVLGPLLTPEGFEMAPWVRWEQEMLMKQYRALLRGDWAATARQFYTGNASLRRNHILAAGGFDEGFRRAEDVELAYRLANNGLEFVFNIQAAGMHFADRSYRAWLDAAYTYGRNDVIFARDRNQKWLLPTIHRGVPGASFFDPIACAGVQWAIPADPDCELGAETCGRRRHARASWRYRAQGIQRLIQPSVLQWVLQ